MAAACVDSRFLRTSAFDFETDVFKGFPHIDQPISHQLLSTEALELGKIIGAYGLEKHVGVFRVHKHFDVAAGDVVVTRAEDGSGDRVATVRVEPATAASLAYMWVFKGSHWSPVQFCTMDFPGNELPTMPTGDPVHSSNVQRNSSVNRPMFNVAVVLAMYDCMATLCLFLGVMEQMQALQEQASLMLPALEKRMTQLNVTEKLGVCLRWTRFLSTPSELLTEETDEMNRTQTFRYNEPPCNNNTITTHWWFDEGNDAASGIKEVKCRRWVICDYAIGGGHSTSAGHH